jgi:hypothetical protein
MKAKLVSESLNKYSFEKKSDPLVSLGVGRKVLIEKWFKDMKIWNYIINDDLTIDAGNTDLDNRNLVRLPYYIQFNHVTGWFDIRNSGLTSLIGCPKIVDDKFNCGWNYLTSLEGCPEYVGDIFSCPNQRNNHKFTNEDVRKLSEVKGYILC